MVQIRQATETDLIEMQNANLMCLPENYNLRYYLYHILSWPHLLHVAIDEGKVVGYVLSKLADDDDDEHKKLGLTGHITSLSVLRSHRKLGIATKLMKSAEREMARVYGADAITLHVRKSNSAAYHLYSQTLGYEILKLEVGYYADGEDAYEMKLQLSKKETTAEEGEAKDGEEKKKEEGEKKDEKKDAKPNANAKQQQQQKGKQQQQQQQQQKGKPQGKKK